MSPTNSLGMANYLPAWQEISHSPPAWGALLLVRAVENAALASLAWWLLSHPATLRAYSPQGLE
jgi:hypothetical protein